MTPLLAGLESYCHTDCPIAATSLSHTHHALSPKQKRSMHSWKRRRCRLSSESQSSTTTFTEGLRATNGPFAVDRAVEGRSSHLSNGQCMHPEMNTNTMQIPVPSGVQTGYEYLSCRRIESLAATRHFWTSTCTGGSGSGSYNHERHTHQSRTHR